MNLVNIDEQLKLLRNNEDKIIHNFIIIELISLMKKYNNLLNKSTAKKSNLPSEMMLKNFDKMFEMIDSSGMLVEEKFDNFRMLNEEEKKLNKKQLKNVTVDWKDIYSRFNFLITLFKVEEAKYYFIHSISKIILNKKDNYENIKDELDSIPKEIIMKNQVHNIYQT